MTTPITTLLASLLDALPVGEKLSPQFRGQILAAIKKAEQAAISSGGAIIEAQAGLTRPSKRCGALATSFNQESGSEEADSRETRKSLTADSHSAPRKKHRLIGHPLPADWIPKSSHYQLATELGRDTRFVENAANEMREWCEANGNRAITRKLSWDAAFSGWLRRNAARGPRQRPSGPSLGDIARGQFDFGDRR